MTREIMDSIFNIDNIEQQQLFLIQKYANKIDFDEGVIPDTPTSGSETGTGSVLSDPFYKNDY